MLPKKYLFSHSKIICCIIFTFSRDSKVVKVTFHSNSQVKLASELKAKIKFACKLGGIL